MRVQEVALEHHRDAAAKQRGVRLEERNAGKLGDRLDNLGALHRVGDVGKDGRKTVEAHASSLFLPEAVEDGEPLGIPREAEVGIERRFFGEGRIYYGMRRDLSIVDPIRAPHTVCDAGGHLLPVHERKSSSRAAFVPAEGKGCNP